tara:strand:+ start:7329 stop:8042 length:714 start_codon:yes stop_codon:yes gene_type:complete
MDIVDLATNLKNQIEKYNINKRLEQKAQDLQPIESKWRGSNESIGVNLPIFTALCERKLAFISQKLFDKACMVSKLLEESKLIELINLSNGKELKQINTELLNLENSLINELQTAWSEFRERITPALPDNIQKGLGENDSNLNKLKNLKRDLQKISQNIPSELERLIKTINQMEEISRNMTSIVGELQTDCPHFMNDFFNKAASGFKLNDLTPEMLTWLKEHGDADSFEIKKQRYSW